MVWGAQFQFAKTHGLIQLIKYVMAGSERARRLLEEDYYLSLLNKMAVTEDNI